MAIFLKAFKSLLLMMFAIVIIFQIQSRLDKATNYGRIAIVRYLGDGSHKSIQHVTWIYNRKE